MLPFKAALAQNEPALSAQPQAPVRRRVQSPAPKDPQSPSRLSVAQSLLTEPGGHQVGTRALSVETPRHEQGRNVVRGGRTDDDLNIRAENRPECGPRPLRMFPGSPMWIRCADESSRKRSHSAAKPVAITKT